jgi:Ca-activated chloride channel family protein
VPVRVITSGSDAPANVGITTMAAGQGADGSELFMRIWNAAAAVAPARVTVFDDDTDALIAAQDITIPAGTDTALTFPGIPPTTTVVRAELSGMERDDLAVDDVAWARTRSGERAKVLLLTPGNLFLERALALLPDLEVSLGAPDGGAPAGFDLYVFDGVLPPDGLPAPLLLLNPPSTSPYAEVNGDLEQPAISNVRTDDPILTDVDLSQTHLAAARSMTTPAWAIPLVLSGESPLVFAGLREGLRTAVVGFDLHASDLPLQTAFPILVANLTGWLLPETTALAPESIAPGAVVALYPRTGADQIELERPDGSTATIPAEPEVLWSGTGRPGSYRVRDLADGTELRSGGFVVNLLDASESDLAGAPDAAQPGDDSGQGTVASGLLSGGDNVARRLLWWPAVAIGIAVLALEWWAFYRGRWRPKLTAPAKLSLQSLIPDRLTRRPRR